MTLPLLFTQLLTTFSSPDFLQSLLLCHQVLPERMRDKRVPGPADRGTAQGWSLSRSTVCGCQQTEWGSEPSGLAMIRSLQLEGTRIQGWLLDKWSSVLLLWRLMLYVFSYCMFHCRSSFQRGIMVLVLFPFAEVLFSGFICVYLRAGHVHTHRCVCVLTGSTQATLMLPGPGETKMQAASLLLSY